MTQVSLVMEVKEVKEVKDDRFGYCFQLETVARLRYRL